MKVVFFTTKFKLFIFLELSSYLFRYNYVCNNNGCAFFSFEIPSFCNIDFIEILFFLNSFVIPEITPGWSIGKPQVKTSRSI